MAILWLCSGNVVAAFMAAVSARRVFIMTAVPGERINVSAIPRVPLVSLPSLIPYLGYPGFSEQCEQLSL